MNESRSLQSAILRVTSLRTTLPMPAVYLAFSAFQLLPWPIFITAPMGFCDRVSLLFVTVLRNGAVRPYVCPSRSGV